MIKVKVIKQGEGRSYSCDNCNKETVPFFVIYELYDEGETEPFVKFGLCEDCSNELSNAHYKTMIEYDKLCKKKDATYKAQNEVTLETIGVLSGLDSHVMTGDPPF